MTEADVTAARVALEAWFESQNISPGDAGVVMSSLLANLFIRKTTNLVKLEQGASIFHAMLLLDIAGELRR